MPKIKTIEKKISNLEGFDVRFVKDGRDVRGDCTISADFTSQTRAKGSYTVSE